MDLRNVGILLQHYTESEPRIHRLFSVSKLVPRVSTFPLNIQVSFSFRNSSLLKVSETADFLVVKDQLSNRGRWAVFIYTVQIFYECRRVLSHNTLKG